MADADPQKTPPQDRRPTTRETEYEDLRPAQGGGPPRPASEPPGGEDSVQTPKTRTDPGSGEH
jgi:hypothetical protein